MRSKAMDIVSTRTLVLGVLSRGVGFDETKLRLRIDFICNIATNILFLRMLSICMVNVEFLYSMKIQNMMLIIWRPRLWFITAGNAKSSQYPWSSMARSCFSLIDWLLEKVATYFKLLVTPETGQFQMKLSIFSLVNMI